MHGCGHLLRVRQSVSGRHGRMWVLGYHHHHHGVVRQDTRWVRGQVGRLRHAVVMRPLRGGVAVLAGGSGTMAAPQAAAGGVLRFTAAARARVCPSSFSACRGGFIAPAHGAAGTFSRAAPVSLAPRGPAAPAACGQEDVFRLIRFEFKLVPAWALTFAVLAAGAAGGVAVAGQLVIRWRLAGEGVRWVGLIGERVHHGPRGGPGERQGGQSVLVRGPAGAIVVVQGQVGHVWAGGKSGGSEHGTHAIVHG